MEDNKENYKLEKSEIEIENSDIKINNSKTEFNNNNNIHEEALIITNKDTKLEEGNL